MSGDQSASFAEQYQALRTGRSVVELADWSSIVVTGSDRQKFLNNFCTNDIKRLQPGESCEAFFTNVKGKIVGHGLIVCREGELLFLGVPGQGPRLFEHLDRYVIREDVQLRTTTSERNFVLVTDSELGEFGADLRLSWNLIGRDAARIFQLTPRDSPFISTLSNQGFVVAGRAAFEAVRIEAGVPVFGIDFDENNLPQEVGRDKEAISFTKGCYLGQETVARIDALGHVNQRIVGVQFTGREVPAVGSELSSAGAVVGRVTSSAYSPALGAPLALAMVRREANAVGTRLNSAVGAGEVIALGNDNQH